MEIPKQKVTRNIDPAWDRIIRLIEGTKFFGRAEIIFKNGLPTDIKPLVPHIKLDSEAEYQKGFEVMEEIKTNFKTTLL